MADTDDVIAVLVRGWARAEHDAGAAAQAYDAGAAERVERALRAFGVEPDAEVQRTAAIHWDGEWVDILRDAVIAARARRDPTWPAGHAAWDAHERRVAAAVDALRRFEET